MTEHSWFREYCEKTASPCMKYFVMDFRPGIEKLVKYLKLILFIKCQLEYL